ncbi:MAG: aminoacyl-tRNA hydrolase [Candidatus Saccharimonadales bacterium]
MALFTRKENTGMEQPLYSVGMTKTLLVVGLGNIGKDYDLTRHNVGFSCLDHFAEANNFPGWTNKKDLKAEITINNLGATRVILCKPTTFMNNSGQAVQAIQHFYKLADTSTIIVHDEIDIPFGQIRLRQGGGHAGHNGVKSVTAEAGENTGRVRIGIANDFSGQADSADFVLGKFTAEEQNHLSALQKEVNSILTEAIYGNGSLPTETRSFII